MEDHEYYYGYINLSGLETDMHGPTDQSEAVDQIDHAYHMFAKPTPRITWLTSPNTFVDAVPDIATRPVWATVWGTTDHTRWPILTGFSFPAWVYMYKFLDEARHHYPMMTPRIWEEPCVKSNQLSAGVLTDTTAYLLPKPIQLFVDNYNHLHSEQDKAIAWGDGDGQYYLHGVKFSEKTWQKIVTCQFTRRDLHLHYWNPDERYVITAMLKGNTHINPYNIGWKA